MDHLERKRRIEQAKQAGDQARANLARYSKEVTEGATIPLNPEQFDPGYESTGREARQELTGERCDAINQARVEENLRLVRDGRTVRPFDPT